MYRVQVTATDHVGLISVASSSPVTVDTSAPVFGAVQLTARYVGDDQASHRVAFDFTGVQDLESGIVETICSLGTSKVLKHGHHINGKLTGR